MSKWISVKDRLPEYSGRSYAVCWRNEQDGWHVGIAGVAYGNISGEFKDAKPTLVFFAYDNEKHIHQYENVEFWLTLPEPPESEETL